MDTALRGGLEALTIGLLGAEPPIGGALSPYVRKGLNTAGAAGTSALEAAGTSALTDVRAGDDADLEKALSAAGGAGVSTGLWGLFNALAGSKALGEKQQAHRQVRDIVDRHNAAVTKRGFTPVSGKFGLDDSAAQIQAAVYSGELPRAEAQSMLIEAGYSEAEVTRRLQAGAWEPRIGGSVPDAGQGGAASGPQAPESFAARPAPGVLNEPGRSTLPYPLPAPQRPLPMGGAMTGERPLPMGGKIEPDAPIEMPGRAEKEPAAPRKGRYTDMEEFVAAATSPEGKKIGRSIWVDFAPISDETADRIQENTGIDVHGYGHALDGSSAVHILNRHGEDGTSLKDFPNQIPLTARDFSLLPGVIEDADVIELGGKNRIVFKKRINGHFIVVEETRNRLGKLIPVTARKEKAAASPSTSETLLTSSEPVGAMPPPNATLPPPEETVKTETSAAQTDALPETDAREPEDKGPEPFYNMSRFTPISLSQREARRIIL